MEIRVKHWDWCAFKEARQNNKNNERLLLHVEIKGIRINYFIFGLMVACSLMSGVQSQVESYQRLKKRYLMLSCLTLSIISYRFGVKWSNPGKGIAPVQHLGGVAIEKRTFGSPSTKVANFTLFFLIERRITGDFLETFKMINGISY